MVGERYASGCYRGILRRGASARIREGLFGLVKCSVGCLLYGEKKPCK
jgi:hypothetical protein